MDKKIFIWDTSNGYIVAKQVMQPDPMTCMRWGGFVKDIKGRNTELYQFATAGNKSLVLWQLDTKKGRFMIFRVFPDRGDQSGYGGEGISLHGLF
jgi:hypothetical protein